MATNHLRELGTTSDTEYALDRNHLIELETGSDARVCARYKSSDRAGTQKLQRNQRITVSKFNHILITFPDNFEKPRPGLS